MLEILTKYAKLLAVGYFPAGPLGGLAMTFVLSICVLALTFPAAVLIALARTSEIRVLSILAQGFVYLVRSMPLLMLVFWIYYFLPYAIGVPLSPFLTMLIAISVFQTGYLSEVIRGAIEAIPRGQSDASSALGFRYWQRAWYIILPQALVNSLPGIVSQFILTIKESSLGYIITFNEVTYTAMQLNDILLVKPVEVFSILALIYFVVCSSLSWLSQRLERAISRRWGERRV